MNLNSEELAALNGAIDYVIRGQGLPAATVLVPIALKIQAMIDAAKAAE